MAASGNATWRARNNKLPSLVKFQSRGRGNESRGGAKTVRVSILTVLNHLVMLSAVNTNILTVSSERPMTPPSSADKYLFQSGTMASKCRLGAYSLCSNKSHGMQGWPRTSVDYKKNLPEVRNRNIEEPEKPKINQYSSWRQQPFVPQSRFL